MKIKTKCDLGETIKFVWFDEECTEKIISIFRNQFGIYYLTDSYKSVSEKEVQKIKKSKKKENK